MVKHRPHPRPLVLRAARAEPEPWLIGAFLLLFGVALAAAMPQIAGAIRGAVADAAGRTSEAAQKPRVQVRVVAVRIVLPTPSGGVAGALVAESGAVFGFAAADAPRFVFDIGKQIEARGVRARAPPTIAA